MLTSFLNLFRKEKIYKTKIGLKYPNYDGAMEVFKANVIEPNIEVGYKTVILSHYTTAYNKFVFIYKIVKDN